MKARFTALDLRAVVKELEPQLEGVRLQNVYDVNPVGRGFLLKFSKSDSKISVVLESGIRMHSTAFVQEKPNMLPSGFAAKLRKHLRGRRCVTVEQIAFDRVVHFQFGSGDSEDIRREHEFHLFIEFFSQGNVILTDWEGKILAILRPVKAETYALTVGSSYDPRSTALHLSHFKMEDFSTSATGPFVDLKSAQFRAVLAAFSPQMLEYCLCEALCVDPATLKKSKKKKQREGDGFIDKIPLEMLPKFISVANGLVDEIFAGNFAGIIQVQDPTTAESLLKPEVEVSLLGFQALKQLTFCSPADNQLCYDRFNDAVDVYFCRMDLDRVTSRHETGEKEAERKLAAVESEQCSRISGLDGAVELLGRKALAVETRAEDVEAALKVAKTALDSGMDWSQFSRLIEAERTRGNRRAEIAVLFSGLKLEIGQVTLQLGELQVDLLISLSAHGNATRLFDLRNQAKHKMERTISAQSQALRSAEQKIRAELQQSRRVTRMRQLQAMRKPFWWEKFFWLISSEGYLVLAGRDAQQNEILVKRYLRRGDVYVHADISGAASLVVRNHRFPDHQLPPPRTLHEAGTFSICASRAWEAKIVTAAWWVRAEQVSKTAPTGEYLRTGSFIIRGSKNFLPPMQLSLSFAFLFVLGEEARMEARQERLLREAEEGSSEDPSLSSVYDKYKTECADNETLKNEFEVLQIIDTATLTDEPKKVKQQKQPKPHKKQQPIQQICEVNLEDSAMEKEASSRIRGKQGKLKKMRKKYGNQDDEERALRMELLASAGKKTIAKVSEPRKQESEPKAKALEVSEQPPPAQTDGSFEIEEEDSNAVSNEFIAADYFTATPDDEQQYAFAVAACFPTACLNDARFRVKLIPGTLKKGKVVRQAVNLLSGPSSCPAGHLRELMRAVPETEMLSAVLPSKLALGISGLETAKLRKEAKKVAASTTAKKGDKKKKN